MDAGATSVTVAGHVATITFGHPRGNSLPGVLLRDLALAFDKVSGDGGARVIILRSEGTGPFCAGASFDELAAVRTPEDGKEFFSGFARVILAMRRAPQPVIARVHGKAVGGGVGLVAASDYAIATTAASVRLSELAVGIGPFVVGPVIEHKIGRGHFGALAIDHDWRDAAWAHRAGLYARVEESVEALDRAVEGLAGTLSNSHAAALQQIKRTLWRGTDEWETLLFERAAISGKLVATDFAQGVIASLGRK